MIYLSCLLAAAGVADLIRARSPRRWVLVAAAGAGLAILIALHALVGANAVVLGVSAGVLLVWIAGTAQSSFTARKVAVGILGIAIAAGIAFGPPAPVAGTLQDWYSRLAFPVVQVVSFQHALAIAALVLVLTETANVIVRTVLELPDGEEAPHTTRGRLGARRPRPAPLKGGRLIGPLERLFLFALALAGQFTAIGAIVAAKGIVRFPELSRDNSRGSNAELFLVGSFTSWALVLVAVLYAGLSG